MMEDHEFCDECPGCRPALIDAETGKLMAKDSPIMKTVNRVWDKETTFAQRKGFIEVTLKNSRNPHEMKLFWEVSNKIQDALKELENG
jgi:hypothetical protein